METSTPTPITTINIQGEQDNRCRLQADGSELSPTTPNKDEQEFPTKRGHHEAQQNEYSPEFSTSDEDDEDDLDEQKSKVRSSFKLALSSDRPLESVVHFVDKCIEMSREGEKANTFISQRNWRNLCGSQQIWTRMMQWLTKKKYIERSGLRVAARTRTPYKNLGDVKAHVLQLTKLPRDEQLKMLALPKESMPTKPTATPSSSSSKKRKTENTPAILLPPLYSGSDAAATLSSIKHDEESDEHFNTTRRPSRSNINEGRYNYDEDEDFEEEEEENEDFVASGEASYNYKEDFTRSNTTTATTANNLHRISNKNSIATSSGVLINNPQNCTFNIYKYNPDE